MPDLRGHGRSDTPHDEDAYAMDAIVGDLLAVLDTAGADRVHYVGYSFGARCTDSRSPSPLRSGWRV